MDSIRLNHLAAELRAGRLDVTAFLNELEMPSEVRLPEATVDLDRRRRCGFPEVVYGEGKSLAALETIFRTLLTAGEPVLATRISAGVAKELAAMFPDGRYNVAGRTFRVLAGKESETARRGRVVVVTAGSSDLPVAEEARETLDWMGVNVELVTDVGVAGPQRVLARLEQLRSADALVVVAGMEGALPSVVGGHVACPVIAVPTSVGYGANFGGVAALLSMLNTCAANVSVVNIDAGFKAAFVAGLIATRAATPKPPSP